ncbi:SDR family NAD(P)-dependent oxidoreductase [Calidifontibacter terrae]
MVSTRAPSSHGSTDGSEDSTDGSDAITEDHGAIDPADLAATLRVLEQLPHLEPGHPDIETVKRASQRMFNRVRKARRAAARQEREGPLREADDAVLAATATGSPLRIDDETQGILLHAPSERPTAGELNYPRGCYICHANYTTVDAFYHWLCPECAAFNHARRDQHVDLSGRRALLTGGRAKIGMYIALMLLRDGADLTITTRFPKDAVRRFRAMPDADDWIHHLTVVGIDLRDPNQVTALAEEVAAGGPLDILINNAAQTVRRSKGAYAHLVDAESAPLPTDSALPAVITFDRISEAHPARLVGSLDADQIAHHGDHDQRHAAALAAENSVRVLQAGSASLEAHLAGTAVDAGGLLPDVAATNSWTHTVDEVDPLELLEVQLCNSVAPFILVSRLRPVLAQAAQTAQAGRAYVVNVSAMEGQFGRRYKGAGHPHTNMAKAALNMLTRTSAQEMFDTDRILMTSVDTGWITDERPHQEKLRIAGEGWHAPLDLVDGAARVYDPIVQGERGTDLFGVFLKDFRPYDW